MPHVKIVVAASADTALPRDRLVNVVHFNDRGPTFDGDGLCADVIDVFEGLWYSASPSRFFEAWSYDVEGTKPVYPNGHAVKNSTSSTPASVSFRERALCLSFYATNNVPRKRGRLYLATVNAAETGVRPSVGIMGAALAFGDALSGIGGADVDWEVWSERDNVGRKVTNVWVDDEWDVMRSRGLKGTTRQLDTVSGQQLGPRVGADAVVIYVGAPVALALIGCLAVWLRRRRRPQARLQLLKRRPDDERLVHELDAEVGSPHGY